MNWLFDAFRFVRGGVGNTSRCLIMRQFSEKVGPANPYEPSHAVSSGPVRRASDRISFGLALVLTGGLFALVLWTGDLLEAFYLDFDVELPFTTIFALSQWPLVGVEGLFVFTLAKEFIQGSPTFVRRCNVLVCLAALILGFAYAAATLLPLIGLIKALS